MAPIKRIPFSFTQSLGLRVFFSAGPFCINTPFSSLAELPNWVLAKGFLIEVTIYKGSIANNMASLLL